MREAAAAHVSGGDEQLSVRVGDLVSILEPDAPDHEGWAFGRCGEREGWFPSGILRAAPAAPAPAGLRRLRSLPARLVPRVTVLAAHAAGSSGELDVAVGDEVEVASVARGWVSVSRPSDGAGGWLPEAAIGGPDVLFAAVTAAAADDALPPVDAPRGTPRRALRSRSEAAPEALSSLPPAGVPFPIAAGYDSEEDAGGGRGRSPPRRRAVTEESPPPLERLSLGGLGRLARDRGVAVGDAADKRAIVDALRATLPSAGGADDTAALLKERDALAEKCAALERALDREKEATIDQRRALDLERIRAPVGTPRRGGRCAICFDADIEIACFPCGHCCACATCAARLTTCSQCNGRIDETRRVYIAGS